MTSARDPPGGIRDGSCGVIINQANTGSVVPFPFVGSKGCPGWLSSTEMGLNSEAWRLSRSRSRKRMAEESNGNANAPPSQMSFPLILKD